MGLDIYLYRYENQEETESLEKQYSDWSESNWNKVGEYSTLTENQKDQLRKDDEDYAISLGLEKGGEDPRKEGIEMPSTKYPDHYFKVGYFRSSYNGGGINNILKNLGLPTLYEIFPHEDEYVFRPDWAVSLALVRDLIAQLKAKPNLRCFDISWNDFRNPNECEIRDEKKAMEVFLNEKERNAGSSYSNIKGHFYHEEPLKVLGLVQGVNKMLFNEVVLPSVYVICEGENEWYINALEIVQETIEFVLSKPDSDKYFLHWSS